MQNGLLALRGAKQPARAASDGFIGIAHHARAAYRADRITRQQIKLHRPRRTALRQDADDFGDDVTGAAHHDGIIHADVLALDFVLIVQRGIGNRHAAHGHRTQPRHRRERAGTPDLHINIQHFGHRLLRRIFVRHRPARFAAGKTQARLQIQPVDLIDHAVNVKRQIRANGGDVFVKRRQRLRTRRHGALTTDRKTPGGKLRQQPVLRIGHGETFGCT